MTETQEQSAEIDNEPKAEAALLEEQGLAQETGASLEDATDSLSREQAEEKNEAHRSEALRLLEAILFASPEPVSLAMLSEQMAAYDVDVLALLRTLEAQYQGRGIELFESDGIFSFRTAPDIGALLKITKQPRRKLPRAAAEVLAIIAYHQPVTRAEIESIRGVETSKGTLDILLELGWVRPGQRRDVPGRPLTWKTTPEFMSHFNLSSLNDLPGLEDLKASGLLDARPIMAKMPEGEGTGVADLAIAEEDADYAAFAEESDP